MEEHHVRKESRLLARTGHRLQKDRAVIFNEAAEVDVRDCERGAARGGNRVPRVQPGKFSFTARLNF